MGTALSAERAAKSSRPDNTSLFSQPNAMEWNSSSSDSLTSSPVAVSITWTHGGHMVFVTGAWDNWSTKTPLRRTGPADPFTAVLSMPIGVHQYKYIVDGNWMHNKSLPTETDQHGNLNNIIDVRPQRQEFDDDRDDNADSCTTFEMSPPSSFDFSMSSHGGGRIEPPDLPPFLTVPPVSGEQLPPPTSSVTYNHLYSSRLSYRHTSPHVCPPQQDYRTLALTKRYKSKLITTLLVSPPRTADV